MTDSFCLDQRYATTRLVTRIQPRFEKAQDAKFESQLVIPDGKGSKSEGGLRSLGYFKINILENPLITVITVVFNGAKYLENAILSVINQTYNNIEYIIIDGGSTDGTLEIIKQYNNQIDYWVSEPDKGIYDAMNKAASTSCGAWLYVLGSDDRLFLNSLYQMAIYLRDESSVYYGNVTMVSDGRTYDGSFNSYKLMYYNICHQSLFYPRSIFDHYRYETQYKTHSDFVLLQKCHGDFRFKLVYVPIVIARYNDVVGVSSTQEDQQYLNDKIEIIKENFSLLCYVLFFIRYYTVKGLAIIRLKNLLKYIIRWCRTCWGQ